MVVLLRWMGRGRTTTGTVIACLLKLRIDHGRPIKILLDTMTHEEVDGGTSGGEETGEILIHSADQLENYAKTEEAKVEELINAVADSGAKVIVSGAAVGEMALHFCEGYKLMVLKISSKFELRRFCRTTGAVAMM
ncbi:T-complex protein 1 subunit theta-like [Humulus lupulus]|uniref:T-complex protein 1 subunit theta-like n=1 Tax=Humulus lupulus TaxID=3486 RepID=UPI002B416B2C|nr:T-complex protein 1 subunit theta-like [Humulus lupulus]